ncbi:hypothetical protein QBC33DRAFT_383042 [Phialemonium atrogriseum]|uniref:Uncharacterized protein n=1 Tax=Phialemonium atrogriseum TaxID=1093897 RepID=A0AAJ0C1S9_9PEZI|nr:uncharacterized protein QBC33DRAFT_383042 [Phialemonium atrogriseum]KAK1768564.1 hypothetical protein QBC33DRAFT_383042 [Phialemonium atrogriseum]
MARRERRRRPRLADILAMASTATAMSLSTFQIITSSSVPIGCILAYNSPISGCSTSDFTQGRTCSDTCVRNIQRVEENIAAACDGVSSTPDTVLGQALTGNLVGLLCPSAIASTPAVVTTSSRQILTMTPSKETTVATSATTTEAGETESPLPPPPEFETTNIPASPVQTGPLGINPTDATGAQRTSAPSAPDAGQGGGSPFDVAAAVASDSRRLAVPWLETLLVASVLAALLR